jgi:hypothetical protein
MFSLALTGVFNGTVATCVRDADLYRLLIDFDKIPGLPTFSTSLANYCVIAAIVASFYLCYGHELDAFIYGALNFAFACISLLVNSVMRGRVHVTMVPDEDINFLFDHVGNALFTCRRRLTLLT